MTNSDYEAALNSAKDLPRKISDLASTAKVKKDELTTQRTSLSGSLPKTVEEITTKVAALTKTHKLPAGAGDQLDAAKQMWTDASSAFSSGNLSDAMAKAKRSRTNSALCAQCWA